MSKIEHYCYIIDIYINVEYKSKTRVGGAGGGGWGVERSTS